MDQSIRKPTKGAVRYFDKIADNHHIVEPGNAHYRDALMVADDYWNDDRQQWVKIKAPVAQNG